MSICSSPDLNRNIVLEIKSEDTTLDLFVCGRPLPFGNTTITNYYNIPLNVTLEAKQNNQTLFTFITNTNSNWSIPAILSPPFTPTPTPPIETSSFTPTFTPTFTPINTSETNSGTNDTPLIIGSSIGGSVILGFLAFLIFKIYKQRSVPISPQISKKYEVQQQYFICQNYSSEFPDELSVSVGDVIVLQEQFSDNWCKITKNDRSGMIPSSSIDFINGPIPSET
jgi:hypothetical protein